MDIQPFTVDVPAAELDELQRRLAEAILQADIPTKIESPPWPRTLAEDALASPRMQRLPRVLSAAFHTPLCVQASETRPQRPSRTRE